MTDRTYSLPPCEPDHPYDKIHPADLVRGVCPKCGGLLDGTKSARRLRALRLIAQPYSIAGDSTVATEIAREALGGDDE
mgnify:CR=1 FL=1